ncbi:carboxymethylenebutenolidase [Tistlia consotensis]|uniref:Carboxymethylenebutenolidase n=1 Tax=Tistlia consotensis USBA 355 TaxID=560819 RepID=A0A1Y6CI70_9PROT|nr:dienelactone hydrolase family protein [Tistlia consotensis]SMF63421.1 carboxymethylenebutenolidase [Tistlia consotensis USBA 355]SNR96182.1 carboxymethylenebutenolidase [Tistlia consotensis]
MPDSRPLASDPHPLPPDPRRRRLLGTLAALPLVPSLAAVLADPELAAAAAAGTETVTLTTEGGRKVSAALAVPARTPAPAVLLVHEWWGLNDQIKSMAAECAREGYLALAVDLYGGRVADTAEGAQALMGAVDAAAATDTLKSWIDWLRREPRSTGKVGTIGWCFGGGWSLNASLAAPVEATVIYYGRVDKTAAQLAPLKGPVLGHFATRDNWINHAMVAGFEKAMDEAGKSYTDYWYDADHAFANPTGARYDKADAAEAWERTRAFLAKQLKG